MSTDTELLFVPRGVTPAISTEARESNYGSSKRHMPPEILYNIIYDAFITAVHTMLSPISGDECLVHRKSYEEIIRPYKNEKTIVTRLASVSHQFREIMRVLLIDVFELGGINLDPIRRHGIFVTARRRYLSLIPYCQVAVNNVMRSSVFMPKVTFNEVNGIHITPLHQLYFYYSTIRAIRGYKMFRPCAETRIFLNEPQVFHIPNALLRRAARTCEAGKIDSADIHRNLNVSRELLKYTKPVSVLVRIQKAFEAESAHFAMVDALKLVKRNMEWSHKLLDEAPNKRWYAGEKERYLEDVILDLRDALSYLEVAEEHYERALPRDRVGIDIPALFSGPVLVLTRITNYLACCFNRDYDPCIEGVVKNERIRERSEALYRKFMETFERELSGRLPHEKDPDFAVMMRIMVDERETMMWVVPTQHPVNANA